MGSLEDWLKDWNRLELDQSVHAVSLKENRHYPHQATRLVAHCYSGCNRGLLPAIAALMPDRRSPVTL
jgi:hypothetical protein